MGKNTGAQGPRDDLEPVGLFEFLRTIEVAAHRKKITRMQERVARFTAYDSAGTTGGGVVVNAAQTAIELGITERSVWRHFAALVDAGWFVQTVKPTRGTGASPGRRARYQCTCPPVDLGLASIPLAEMPSQLPFADEHQPVENSDRLTSAHTEPSDEKADNRLTVSTANSSSDRPTPAESSDSFGDNRLTVLEESSDSRERENVTVSPSGGTPTDGPPPKPVPQQPQPQDAREAVDKSPVDNRPAAASVGGWGSALDHVGQVLTAAISASPRHARPDPPPIVRPDRE